MSNTPIDKDAVIEYLFSALEYQIWGQYVDREDKMGEGAWAKLSPVEQDFIESRHNQMCNIHERSSGISITYPGPVELP